MNGGGDFNGVASGVFTGTPGNGAIRMFDSARTIRVVRDGGLPPDVSNKTIERTAYSADLINDFQHMGMRLISLGVGSP